MMVVNGRLLMRFCSGRFAFLYSLANPEGWATLFCPPNKCTMINGGQNRLPDGLGGITDGTPLFFPIELGI
jgi:hypothetical protein